MIIDTHIHVWSYPALADARDRIKSTQDLVSFRTRFPDLYDRTLHEDPVDNSDQLIADMDAFGIDKAFVQARPGAVTNDQVAESVRRHPDRLYGMMRIGHDQEAAYEYLEDPAPVRESAAASATGWRPTHRSTSAFGDCARDSSSDGPRGPPASRPT